MKARSLPIFSLFALFLASAPAQAARLSDVVELDFNHLISTLAPRAQGRIENGLRTKTGLAVQPVAAHDTSVGAGRAETQMLKKLDYFAHPQEGLWIPVYRTETVTTSAD